MKKLLVILLLAFVAGAACRRTSSPSAPATPSPAASPVEQLNHLAGGATPPPQTKYFKGSIGTTLDLQMKLVREGDQLTGSYYYQKVGTPITPARWAGPESLPTNARALASSSSRSQ